MSDRLIVNATTGEEQREPLTAEEQSERDAMAAASEAERQEEQGRQTRETTLRERADNALAALRSQRTDLAPIISSSGTLTTAQLSGAVRILAGGQDLLCRVAIALIRLAIRKFDDTE